MIIVGWRERVELPELGIDAIKAKIDSSRRGSVLHVSSLQSFERGGGEWLRFAVRPDPARTDVIVAAAATKARGTAGEGALIETSLTLGQRSYPVELTLTTGEPGEFALIIGRSGLKRGSVIDPHGSYLLGQP